MKMMRVAVLKPHKYGTRQLTAGEEYEAPIREAVALVATKKARFVKDKKPAVAAATAASATTEMSLDRLRLEATQIGIDVDGRWGVHRLRSEIEQAKSR